MMINKMIRQIPKNNNLKSLFFSTATNLSSYYFNFSKPPIFPRLPVLDKLTEEINGDKPNLNKYFLIAGQHALETTGSLFEWMINELSLPPNNIFMVGKTYSSSADVIKRLRNELGIRHQTNTPQVTLGGFIDSYDTDITKTWDRFARYIHEKISDGSPISGIFVLDDVYHVKHYQNLKLIQSDPRFNILTLSKEKFGFCIAEYNYDKK